jgi:hypothetical protein
MTIGHQFDTASHGRVLTLTGREPAFARAVPLTGRGDA